MENHPDMTTEPNTDLINDDFDEEGNPIDPNESNDLRNLRRTAKEAKRLQRRNEELEAGERELAFYRAGLKADELQTPVGALFAKAYDGELSSEAIKAAWAEVGGTTPAPDPANTITDEEAAFTQERQRLASGAAGDTGEPPPKPVRGAEGAAATAARAALANGASRDDAMGVAFSELAAAAARGDQSVIVPFGGMEHPE